MLRDFLQSAETGKIATGGDPGGEFDSPFEEAAAIAIRRNGYGVVPQVGVSAFWIDLGVLDPEKRGRFSSVLNMTEQPIAAHVPRVTGTGSDRPFSKGSAGGCTGFGAVTGSAIRTGRLSGCWCRCGSNSCDQERPDVWRSLPSYWKALTRDIPGSGSAAARG